MRVKPAHGRQVRIPEFPYPFLSENGGNVPETPYWFRRLVRGDCVLVEDSPAPEPKAEAPKKAAAKVEAPVKE